MLYVDAAVCSCLERASAGRETVPPAFSWNRTFALILNAGKIVRFVIESEVSYVGEVGNRVGESGVTYCRYRTLMLSGGVGKKVCLGCSVLMLE